MPENRRRLRGRVAQVLDDDLRKRIEALNKKPLQNLPDEQSSKIGSSHRELTRRMQQPVGKEAVLKQGNSYLEEVLGGKAAQAPVGPGYQLIEQPAVGLDSLAALIYRRFVALIGHPDAEAVGRIIEVCGAKRVAPQEVLFLDLETTGLGTTPIFLVGTMECSSEGFLFRQYFARDYSEEISILAAAAERLRWTRLLITFNGKSFDEPYMRTRAAAMGIQFEVPCAHLDLLQEARRKYRTDLPNCRLQTLEQMVCGRYREEDIPGSEIPAAYDEFVRTSDVGKIRLILRHNLYDLLTMAELMHRLWGCE